MTPKIRPFRPMLAVNAPDVQDIQYPVYVSPKFDGMRIIIRNGQPVQRSLDPVRNHFVRRALSNALLEGLDGEVILGNPTAPHVFRDTSAAMRREDGEPYVTFWVFDQLPNAQLIEFQHRIGGAKFLVDNYNQAPNPHVEVKLIPQILVRTPDELSHWESVWVSEGYEGLMVRDPQGPYKYGRSTINEGWLLKVKRFLDAEATIVGTVELMRNHNPKETNRLGLSERSSHAENLVPGGVLGTLVVKTNDFASTFEIGTGFTAAERAELWARRESLIGQIVTFKYQQIGSMDKPRLPVFKGFRSAEDLDRPDTQ